MCKFYNSLKYNHQLYIILRMKVQK
uniref:Uncharacterized protein n=1 Tax=Rhizophora mucronata TaxID=61149 RepID=A0A2P2QH40_RHIMU